MNKHNIVIKFNKTAIHARNNQIISLKCSETQDNFLNQFTYRSIVMDEILSMPQNNTINYDSLKEICYVEGLDNITLDEAKSLAKKMATYDFVEYAYVEAPETQPLSELNITTSSPYTETNIEEALFYLTYAQGYKDGITKHHKGIDMEYAWSLGVTGQGIRGAVVENEINFDHINLKRDSFINLYPGIKQTGDHGTATSGIMYANDLGFGLKGLVHGADYFYGVISQQPDGLLGGLIKLLTHLNRGDVISISMSYGQLPLDVEPGFWDIAKTAITDGGLIICIAAGNGYFDLDTVSSPDWDMDAWRARPDNGLIYVGGGHSVDQSRLDYSNYGSKVYLQGWGHKVTTLDTGRYIAYAPGQPEENRGYNLAFYGTSSATPIVASAAIAVQSWYKQQTGQVLNAIEMRQLLIETGTPQTTPESTPLQHIGPLPNIRNAIEELKKHF